MTQGPRYWNEDAQRWEYGTDAAAPATPPPPPRPQFLPPVREGQDDAGPARHTPTDGEPAAPPPSGPPGDVTGPVTRTTVSVPPGSRGPGRPLVWGVLGGAVAVGAAVALVLTPIVKDDDEGRAGNDKPAASASTSPTGTPPSGTSPSGDASPTEEPFPSGPSTELPADFELYQDDEGFTIARPRGWTRETSPSQHGFDVVDYRSEDGFRRLQVYQVGESSPGASFDLFLSEAAKSFDGFEKVALEQLDEGDADGMRLEYRVDSLRSEPDAGGRHIQDIRFRSPHDGRLYAIAAYGAPTDGGDPELDLALTALRHFCPPDTFCG